jgi:tetratricopeptide (TPR) repeat protein
MLLGSNALAQDAPEEPPPEAVPADGDVDEAPPPPEPPKARPWAEGVSQDNQEQALALYEKANQDFDLGNFAAALKIYREALTFWDHPAIRYNIAICLIHANESTEAFTHLQKAMAHGVDPLGSEELFKRGQTYEVLLRGQLHELVIETEQPDVRVSLDGQELFVGPGKQTLMIAPGAHQVLGEREGFLAFTSRLDVRAGQTSTVTVVTRPLSAGQQRFKTRWKPWIPWTVAGAGLAVAAVGIPFQVASSGNFSDFDSEFDDMCPEGCLDADLSDDLKDKKSKAESQRTIAIAMYATGGIIAATGVVLAVLNRPQPLGEDVQITATKNSVAVGWSF